MNIKKCYKSYNFKALIFAISLFLSLIAVQNLYSETFDFENILNSIAQSYSKVKDYSCMLYKKELVQGEYITKRNIIYKFMKPQFYYIRWTEGDDEGMEAIYAGAKYNNQMRLHLSGLMGFLDVSIDPRGKTAMKDCRHSILDSDIGFIINILKKNFQKANKSSQFKVNQLRDTEFEHKYLNTYELLFPDEKSYYGRKIVVCIDEKLNLPVKFEVYNSDFKLIEDYRFSELRINNGFGAKDFDTDNPDYGF